MKSNVRSIAAALLSAALTFGALPVCANESASSQPSAQSNPEAEISAQSDGTNEISETVSEESSETSSEPSAVELPTVPRKPSTSDTQIDTGDSSSGSASSSSSKTSSEQSSDSSSSSSSESTSDSSSEGEGEGNISDYVTIDTPSFSSSDNQLHYSFKIKEVPDALAFQLNWNPSSDATIDSTPVAVKIDSTEVTIKPEELKKEKEDDANQVIYKFSSEQLAALKEGSEVVFVFQAYPGFSNNNVSTTGWVMVQKGDKADTYKYSGQQTCDFTLNSEWKSVEFNYNYISETWTLSLEASTKPTSLSVLFETSPTYLFKKDGVAVKVDGKSVADVKAEDVESDAQKQTSSSEDNSEDKTGSNRRTLRVTLPESAVESMTDSSKISIDLKVNTDDSDTAKKVALNSKATVDADIDNGIHPVTYTPSEFTIGAEPIMKWEPNNSNNTLNDYWKANLTLQAKPQDLTLTFEQASGNALGSCKKVTLDNAEVKPNIKEETINGHKAYVLEFSKADVEKMNFDSKISVEFGLTPPSTGSTSEKINLTYKDGNNTLTKSASFTVQKASSGSNSTTTGGAKTAAETGLYWAIGVFAAALIAFACFFFASKKKKKS